MKQKISYILLFSALFIFIPSCKEEKEAVKGLGSIYGSVVDKYTGKNVRNAAVGLQPIGLKVITGEDGYFEFPKVEEDTYWLSVTKAGYDDYKSDKIQIKGNGDNKQVNVLLESLTTLKVLDNNEVEVDSVNFGSEYSDIVRTFSIANIGGNELTWQITKTANWITNIEPSKGTLNAGVVQPIVVTINRALLVDGKNRTKIHVTSNNGSKQLTVIAENLKAIATKEASDILAFSAVLNAQVLRNLNPSMMEYGFVYSQLPAPSLTNGAIKMSASGSPKNGEYMMRIENLEREKKYYFRAYITNNKDTLYGEQKDFTTKVHAPSFSFGTITSTSTTITANYKVSDAGIPLQEVGLCWSTNPIPSIEGSHKAFGVSATSYNNKIEGLNIKTTYYIRAYAINEDGEHYSTIETRRTNDGLPIVTTSAECTKGPGYLVVTGTAISDEEFPITLQGFCYGVIPHPIKSDGFKEVSLEKSTLSCQLDNLQQGTKYYFRAYAENINGPQYGNEQDGITKYGPTTLTGYVRDQAGNSVQNATVEEYNTYSFSKTTDSQGFYEVSFDIQNAKSLMIRAYKDGYEQSAEKVDINPGQINEQDFVIASATPTQQELGSYVILPDGSLMVQTVDKVSAHWNSANSSCEESTLGGYTDWRLPTLDELKKIYTYRAQIGGFPSRAVTNNNYWSGTSGSNSGYYYYVNFNDGTSAETRRVNTLKVRAVRTIK